MFCVLSIVSASSMTSTATSDKLNLLIVDDQQIIIDGLTSLLKGINTITVKGGCSDPYRVCDAIEVLRPDVILMDLNMPEMDGIECIQQILESYPHQKILMLTGYDDTELIRDALAKGAMGYVLKNIAKDELVHAIQTVFTGKRYLDQSVQDKVIASFIGNSEPTGSPTPSADDSFNLSKREIEVLTLIADGKTSAKIADALFISTNTVDTHRKNIMAKCGVKNIAELVSFANKHGLL